MPSAPAFWPKSTVKSVIVEVMKEVEHVAALTDSNIKIQVSIAMFVKALTPEDVRQAFKLPLRLCRCACCIWISLLVSII